MPMAPIMDSRPIEYVTIHAAIPTGPSIGRYADREIPEIVEDAFGRRYTYVGIASRKGDGKLDVESLAPGEFILPPALVYRLEDHQHGVGVTWLRSLFGMH